MSDNGEFAAIMKDVALAVMSEFMGQPNKALSTTSNLRWGERGSFSVDLGKGTWHDHSDQTGGGVLDLLKTYKGFDKPEAVAWLVEKGYLQKRDNGQPAEPGQPAGKFAGFMDDHPVATFQYFDDQGNLAYEVLKFAKTAPRRYMQRRPHPSGRGWIWKLKEGKFGRFKRSADWWGYKAESADKYEEVAEFPETKWFLYHRDEVMKAVAEGRQIILAEGEKDVETLRAWGFVATTNQGGAKNWKPELDGDLHGADILILPDNDASGKARIQLRAASFREFAKRVRVLDLADHWPDMPEKKDVTDWKDEAGGTQGKLERLIAKAPLWKPERPKSRFGAIPWGARRQPRKRLEFIVDGWIPEVGVTFIGGPSGSGKSFLALHVSMCVCRGLDFFDRPVKKRGVIYQAGEGGIGLLDRMDAYGIHFKVPDDEDIPFELLPSKIDIFSKDSKDTENLIAEIKALALTMKEPVGLVVIDTLSKATVGADEINGKDTAAILANIERIRDECNCNVIVVHHMNAEGKKLRGHSSLRDNSDTVILIQHDKETGHRDAILDKQKDGEDGLKLKFTLGSVPVRQNEVTGADVSSCVVLTVTEKERLKAEQARLGYSPSTTERRILRNLFAASERHGKFIASEAEGPRAALGRIVVHWDNYRDITLEQMVEIEDKKKARDQIRNEFKRAKENLIRYGIINVVNPYMWWDGKPVRGFRNTFPKKALDEFDQQPMSEGMREVIDADYEVPL